MDKILSDEKLKNWRDYDVNDLDLDEHMIELQESGKIADWLDASDEAARMFGLMFKYPLDRDDAIRELFSTASSTSMHATVCRLVKKLGVDEKDLYLLLESDDASEESNEAIERIKKAMRVDARNGGKDQG